MLSSGVRKYIPQILFLLFTSTLWMSYFIDNVVNFQILIYFIILLCYLGANKQRITNQKQRIIYVLAVFLSFLYVISAFFDLYIYNEPQVLYGSNVSVLFFMVNGILLPLLVIPRIKNEEKYHAFFVVFAIVVSYGLYISYSNIMSGNILYSGGSYQIRGNENLGVIQYGHLGLTAGIVGVMFLAKTYHNWHNEKKWIVLSALLIALGLFSMLMSGTRSAMMAVFFIAFIYIIANGSKRSIFLLAFVFLSFFFLSDALLEFADSLGTQSVARMFRLLEEGGDQSSGRIEIWQYAFSEILKNPISGVSCFFSYSGQPYVHNAFIEIAYAMGLFVGCIFVYINFYAVKCCVDIFKSKNIEHSCFAMLFLQYLVYSFFSESIIRLSLYWFFLAMVLNIQFQKD